MKITLELLKTKNACKESIVAFIEHNCTDLHELVQKEMVKGDSAAYNNCNWLLIRLFTKENNVKYAIFAAEQVLPIFEKKYPEDNRPRNAMNAIKKLLSGGGVSRDDIVAAADAAADAATAADTYATTDAAAAAAVYAVYAAAAAVYAATAAAAAAYAAYAAYATYASYAAAADAAATKTNIINYGLHLITDQEKIEKETK